jgi:hypothetical protein
MFQWPMIVVQLRSEARRRPFALTNAGTHALFAQIFQARRGSRLLCD